MFKIKFIAKCICQSFVNDKNYAKTTEKIFLFNFQSVDNFIDNCNQSMHAESPIGDCQETNQIELFTQHCHCASNLLLDRHYFRFTRFRSSGIMKCEMSA
jgi:hypothetical protein